LLRNEQRSCNFSELIRYKYVTKKQKDMDKRRKEILEKAEEKIRIERQRKKRYNRERAEASIMLQVYEILGYVATSF